MLLIVGVAVVFIMPLILTRPALFEWMGLSGKSSEIGDAIGGITAPFISLISIILVYKSFKKQIDANDIQKDALKQEVIQNRLKNQSDALDALLREIKDEFYKLRYKRRTPVSQLIPPAAEGIYEGEESLEKYAEDIKQFGDRIATDTVDFGHSIRYLVLLTEILQSQLLESIIPMEGKRYFAKKFLSFYEAKIQFHIKSLNADAKQLAGARSNLTQLHEDTEQLLRIIEELYATYELQASRFN